MFPDVTSLYVTYLPVEVILSFFESCEDGDGDVKALELILGDGREPTVLHGTETQTGLSNIQYCCCCNVVKALCGACVYVCVAGLLSKYPKRQLPEAMTSRR